MSRINYEPGELVLVRNTAIEMSLGPYEIIEHTMKGNYRLKELDRTLLNYRYAGFCIIPYITRNHPFMKQNFPQEDSDKESSDNLEASDSLEDLSDD